MRQGREWQCGTIQFDLFMPSRFGVAYVIEGSQLGGHVLARRLAGALAPAMKGPLAPGDIVPRPDGATPAAPAAS